MQPPKLEIVCLLHSLQSTFRLVVTGLTLICTLLLCVIETLLIMVNVYRFLKTGLKVLLLSSPLEIHISTFNTLLVKYARLKRLSHLVAEITKDDVMGQYLLNSGKYVMTGRNI